jgi:hypothetical protein
MNERIEQLAVRAGATLEKGYIELSDGQFMLSDNIDLDKTNLDLEKFAELLITAVMAEVKDEVQFQCGWANAEIVENRVKKVFGV